MTESCGPKEILTISVDEGKLSIRFGAGVSFQTLAYVMKVADLQLTNQIIKAELQPKQAEPTILTPGGIMSRLHKGR